MYSKCKSAGHIISNAGLVILCACLGVPHLVPEIGGNILEIAYIYLLNIYICGNIIYIIELKGKLIICGCIYTNVSFSVKILIVLLLLHL